MRLFCILHFISSMLLQLDAARAEEKRDEFYWLDRLNRASVVMLTEQQILSGDLAAEIAAAIDHEFEASEEPGFVRTGSYLTYEHALIERAGPEVAKLHIGRSAVDLGRTSRRLQLRDDLLQSYQALIDARRELLKFAQDHAGAVVPGYTLGVQAQPISMGHYITGYVAVLARHADLLESAYENINQSPFGSAALGTSSFPLDRHRLAVLLGFDAPIYNSFDAVQLATAEVSMRVVGASAAIAITIGELMSDLEAQYRMSDPWLSIPATLSSGSSIMPQKRNPDLINITRRQASGVLGDATKYMFMAHNLAHGFPNEFAGPGPNEALQGMAEALMGVAGLFATLQFDEGRALDEVLNEYGTATELANTLQREADVPFREAHGYVSELVDFGRSKGLRALDIQYEEAKRIYSDFARGHGMKNEMFPLNEADFRRALSPQNMVLSAKGLGGPQPSEVAKMIRKNSEILSEDDAWLRDKRAKLLRAERNLDAAFSRL